jgi:hypothetical protein
MKQLTPGTTDDNEFKVAAYISVGLPRTLRWTPNR